MSVTDTAQSSRHRPGSVVYADFTSPASYLASVRQDRLIAAGLATPQWHAVEHRPGMPVTGVRLDSCGRATRGRELIGIRQLRNPGEVFDARVPAFIPSTRAAVLAYAEAWEAGLGDPVRRLLFEAYWVHGADIGSPELLRHLLDAAHVERTPGVTPGQTLPPGSVVTPDGSTNSAAYLRARDWQSTWTRLGAPVDLTVVTPNAVVWGHAAVRALDLDPVLAA